MHLRARALLALSGAALAACSGSKDGGTGVAAVTVDPQAAALCVGDTLTFTARLLDASGNAVPGSPVRWTSSAPQTVAVDSVSGVAHALALGTVQISASVGSLRSANPGRLDVPSDLAPQFVPDTVVLAPGDTFTLGVRLRRASAGPVPNHTPVITPSSDAVASLDATGLVTATTTAGTSSLALTSCGFTGHGAARVFTPPDSVTGLGYLWISGPAELRVSMGTQLISYTLSSTKPAFQLYGTAASNSKNFVYEDTLQFTGTGSYAVDSLLSSEAGPGSTCKPPRPFAAYGDNSSFTSLFSMHGGSTAVTAYSTSGFRKVSGRVITRMRGIVSAVATTVDTLQAIYTFSAPLRDTTGVCP
jgi:Big-like domain-containing protein